jgi:hypothetical protein
LGGAGFCVSGVPPGAGGGVEPSGFCSSAIQDFREDHYD